MPNRPIKKWIVPPILPESINENLKEFPLIFRQILFNRGIKDIDSANKYLSADMTIHDPFLLKDMKIAVTRVLKSINEQEQVVIFGDYDVDGVTATALMFEMLTRLGGKAIKFIPNRFDEGYGFSFDALESVLELHPDLIITVDCGVRSVKEIDQANMLGIDVIITDHHQPHDLLPEACAIICPKQPDDEYPFKDLAGVGLAYKFAEAISREIPGQIVDANHWLDLVALGTIADLAPLTDENRALVRKGLEIIQTGKRPGLAALAKVSGVNIQKTTSENIGFMLGPRLNAAGRLSTAETAFNLLISTDSDETRRLASVLDKENSRRQMLTREIQIKVESQIDNIDRQWLLFNFSEEFNEGVIGLAASKLAESYHRPSIIGTQNGDFIRASCRSIPEINITSILDQCADLLVQHGGHSMAAGLKLELKNKDIFFERISSLIEAKIEGQDIQGEIEVDTDVLLPDLYPQLLDLFPLLEPTGIDNPPPLFMTRNVEILSPKAVGRERDHLKFAVRNTKEKNEKNPKRVVFDAIGFNFGYLKKKLSLGARADILFSYEWNEYNGTKRLQLNVRDIRLNHDVYE